MTMTKEEKKHKDSGQETKKQEPGNPAGPEGANEKEFHDQQVRIAELTDHLKRTLAEFDNYRKRVEREGCERAKFASQDVIKKILPVLDNLERAQSAGENAEEIKKGVKLIHQQLKSILKEEHVEKMETVGAMFDPHRHEALMQGEADTDGIILEEFEPGYEMHGKVIKHARVKVGRKAGRQAEGTGKTEEGTDEDNEEHSCG